MDSIGNKTFSHEFREFGLLFREISETPALHRTQCGASVRGKNGCEL